MLGLLELLGLLGLLWLLGRAAGNDTMRWVSLRIEFGMFYSGVSARCSSLHRYWGMLLGEIVGNDIHWGFSLSIKEELHNLKYQLWYGIGTVEEGGKAIRANVLGSCSGHKEIVSIVPLYAWR